MLAGSGAEVDDVIGCPHDRLVMFDDDHRVAEVSKALERADQPVIVDRVEADGRLVADVEHAHEARADLGGEADALAFAAGEG